jgi:hypothetical protein
VFPAINNSFGSNQPAISLSNVAIGATQVTLSVAFTPTISAPSPGVLLISLSGSTGFACVSNSALSFSSPPSGASGQVTSCSQVGGFYVISLTYNLGASLFSLVAFSFGSVSNPSNAQLRLSSVSAAMLNSGGTVIFGKSNQGTYPEIARTFGLSKPFITLNNIVQGTSNVLMTVTISPVTLIQPGNKLVITFAGAGFACGAAPVNVSFKVPSSGSPSAVASCASFVMTTTFNFGTFPTGKSISFVVPGVTNPSVSQSSQSSVAASLTTAAGDVIGRDFVGTFPAIRPGSLGSNLPAVSLSSITANSSLVSMFITLTPMDSLPVNANIFITLSGSVPQQLSTNAVTFTSPSEATDPALSPTATASISGGVLSIRVASGIFPGEQTISLSLPGTVQNALDAQAALSNVAAAVTDTEGIVVAQSATGTMVAIVSGSLGTNAPSISLSNVAKDTSAVTMTVSLTPAAAVPTGSAVLITLGGSAPQSLSASTVAFTSPGTGSPTATAGVAGAVLTVTLTGGTLSAGSQIVFTLPGTVRNTNQIQPASQSVKSCILNSQGVIIASSFVGTHPAVTIPFFFFDFDFHLTHEKCRLLMVL